MGNGSRLTLDIETRGLNDNALTEQDIEDLAKQAQAAFGQPSQVFASPQQFAKLHQFFMMGNPMIMETYPQYAGTPWSTVARLTKREHAVAKIHTFLTKLKVLKNLSEEDMEQIKNKSIKRLKRARWAQYNRKK